MDAYLIMVRAFARLRLSVLLLEVGNFAGGSRVFEVRDSFYAGRCMTMHA
jgi:hypothetical protein